MKKPSFLLVPALVVAFLSGLSFMPHGSNQIVAKAASNDFVDLGKSINLRSSPEFNAENFLERGILNSTFKETVSPIKTDILIRNYQTTSSYQAELFSNSVSTSWTASTGVQFPVDCAMFGISSEFSNSMSVDYHSYKEQFFYRQEYQVKDHKLEIPTYLIYLQNPSTYSSTYISLLNLVVANQMSPSQFFSAFGTHLLVGGIYGGMYTSDYTLLTNQFIINSSTASSIKTAVSASLADTSISGEAEFTASILSAVGKSSSSVTTSYHAYSIGGDYPISTGPQNCAENMSYWDETVTANSALILPSYEGLIPLSSAIPNTFSSTFKANMASALNAYIAENNNDFSAFEPLTGINNIRINNFISGSPNETMVRSSQYRIKANDPYDPDQDQIAIFQNSTLTSDYLYTRGFRYISFKITIKMCEIDDGIQEILIYDGANNLLTSKTDIELGGGSKQTSYTTEHYYFNNINLTSNSSNYLYLRYGAHGYGNDDWYNKEVSLDIVFSKTALSGTYAIDGCTTYWN